MGAGRLTPAEWLLANNSKVAIFQLVDDHSRLALASLVASGENSEAAIRVVKTSIKRHGVPQKFLSDYADVPVMPTFPYRPSSAA